MVAHRTRKAERINRPHCATQVIISSSPPSRTFRVRLESLISCWRAVPTRLKIGYPISPPYAGLSYCLLRTPLLRLHSSPSSHRHHMYCWQYMHRPASTGKLILGNDTVLYQLGTITTRRLSRLRDIRCEVQRDVCHGVQGALAVVEDPSSRCGNSSG